MVSQETIAKAVERIIAQFHPLRIILFGSHARGTADNYSDVDFLVICNISGNKRALMLAMDLALEGLGIARDILVMSPDEFERDRMIPGTIARPAWKEGVILYDANSR